jgi:hypothetical protein
VAPTFVSVFHSLRNNNIGDEGAKALGTACRDELTVYLDANPSQVFEAQRNKTRLIRQFGATPLNRFRLYLCGFGGLFVLVGFVRLNVCIRVFFCFRVLRRS